MRKNPKVRKERKKNTPHKCPQKNKPQIAPQQSKANGKTKTRL